jgi:hypothetical protein
VKLLQPEGFSNDLEQFPLHGLGHRVLGLAQKSPKDKYVGLDMNQESILNSEILSERRQLLPLSLTITPCQR